MAKGTLHAIVRQLLPMVGVILVTAVVHFLLFFMGLTSTLSAIDLTINYLIFVLFFLASEAAVWQHANLNAKKKEFKRGLMLRFVIASLFLIISTENAPEPFLRALHFMVPFLGFTVVSFLRFRKSVK